MHDWTEYESPSGALIPGVWICTKCALVSSTTHEDDADDFWGVCADGW